MWKFFTSLGLEKVQAAPIVASLDYAQGIASINPNGATEAAATTVLTSNPVNYDGTPIWIEVFCPWVQCLNTATSMLVGVWDGATDLGNWGRVDLPTNSGGVPFFAKGKYTPSAGIHTFTVRAWSPSFSPGYGLWNPGPGGIGNYKPAFINIYKA